MGGGGKGGSPSGFTTTTANASSAPWAAQQPYLEQGFQKASDLFNNYQPQYYPGMTAAPINPNTNAGLNSLAGYAANTLPGFTSNAMGFNSGLLSGDYTANDPSLGILQNLASGGGPLSNLSDIASGARLKEGNPYITGLTDSIKAQVVPSIQKQFIDGGGLSGSFAPYATAQGVAAALGPLMFQQYQSDTQNQMQAAGLMNQGQLGAAGALSSAYGGDIGRQLQGLALAPQTGALGALPGQTELSAGTTEQGQQQNIINDAIQRWNYGQTLPYSLLNQFLGQIGGNYGGQSSSATSNPYYINQGANALSGGLGGALLGSQVAGMLPEAWGIGSGLGAGVGGAAGLLMGLI
jgi:hypothetical protein